MIEMVVFDMAGTTVDENNVVYKTLELAINEKGFDFTLEEVLAHGAGKEKLQAIRSILASKRIVDEAIAAAIFDRFLGLLERAYHIQEIFEQPDASKTFEVLRASNVRVVLNTGYNRETAEALTQKLGWTEGVQFDLLVTASDVAKNRPDPDMIMFAMNKFGVVDGQRVIKVGDSVIDIEEGQNAGCRASVGVTTGAHTRAQLESASPDFIIDSLKELPAIITQVSRTSSATAKDIIIS